MILVFERFWHNDTMTVMIWKNIFIVILINDQLLTLLMNGNDNKPIDLSASV